MLAEDAGRPGGARLEIVLAVCLAAGAFMAVMAAAVLVAGPGLKVKFFLYGLGFVVVPLSVWFVWRRVEDLRRLDGAAGAEAAAAVAAGSLALVPVAVRLLSGALGAGPTILTLIAACAWLAGAAWLLGPRGSHVARRLAPRTGALWTLACVAVAGALLCFPTVGLVNVAAFLGLLPFAALLVYLAVLARRVALPLWAGIVLDVGFVVLLLLAIPNLDLYQRLVPAALGSPSQGVLFVEDHMNFFLGPANEVLHGRAVLVDTSSQYGVLPIYLIALWAKIDSPGYGAMSLLNGILIALYYVGGYIVMRLAGVARALAMMVIGAAAAATLPLVVAPSLGTLMLQDLPQDGPLRLGLPLLVIVAATVAARRPGAALPMHAVCLGAVAGAAVWSLEVFAYTVLTYMAIVALDAVVWDAAGGWRPRCLRKWAFALVISVLGAWALYALLTLLAAGQLPDPSLYFGYFSPYSTGDFSDLAAFAITPWSLGLPIGAIYACSAIAILVLAVRRDPLLRRYRSLFIALAGSTVYGAAELSYFVSHSTAIVGLTLSLPAFLLAGLWLWLVVDGWGNLAFPARVAALGLSAWIAALVIAPQWSSLGERAEQSALGHLGGSSLTAAVSELWRSPPLDPAAERGRRLLERYVPGGDRALVLTTPDLNTAILLQSGRGNLLPLGQPSQSTLVARRLLAIQREAIDAIPTGTRMLTQRSVLRQRLAANPLTERLQGFYFTDLAPLQEWVLRELRRRFALRTLSLPHGDLAVVELSSRHSRTASESKFGAER